MFTFRLFCYLGYLLVLSGRRNEKLLQNQSAVFDQFIMRRTHFVPAQVLWSAFVVSLLVVRVLDISTKSTGINC